MKSTKFGIEIETTGLTRSEAAVVVGAYLNGKIERTYDNYDTYKVIAQNGQVWKLMSDASIKTQKKQGGKIVSADKSYSVELVSPILTYEQDIETLQEIIRRLRKAGSFTNETTGCHIHLDNKGHTPRSIRNFINIIASKNDLFYKALQIEPERARFCKKLDQDLVERMNTKKPETFEEIAQIWYDGYNESSSRHYHSSRYHFCNLHSFFQGNHTIELRGFNAGVDSKLHAGVIRSYVVLALALNQQALTQKCASSKKNQVENEKFAMRTFLNRIGLIGEEFKNCREHLCKNLEGDAAFRFGRVA